MDTLVLLTSPLPRAFRFDLTSGTDSKYISGILIKGIHTDYKKP